MYLVCPNCQGTVECVEASSGETIRCPACGSTFRFDPEKTGPWNPGDSPRQAAPVEIGQTISHYRLVDRLGSGGMGVVYKAHDGRLGRSVALKFLPAEYAQDGHALERFQREARTASALNHTHSCTIHDIAEYEGQPFFVMEFIEGCTLRVLARQRLSLDRLVQLGEQVAKALAVAHAVGIVHRDIKPDNIMVREDGYVKVVDFGLARPMPKGATQSGAEAAEVTDPGTLLGTLRYMSPEQARAEAASSASDIFALGIVFYELATGHHPFAADSQVAVLHAILSQVPVPPAHLNPEISGTLAALIERMLEKDARLRPSAAEVQAVLAELTRTSTNRPAGAALVPIQRHTVGRQRERAELRAGFAAAAAGRGLFLCVAGEPGIGKTTLVEDFLQDLAAEGSTASIARGRCSERLAGAEAYLPFLEALDSLLHGDAGEQVARVMKVVAPTWYVQLAPLAAEDSSFARVLADAKAASQERLKRELATLLQEMSRLRPLVLFLDDLHWADASTVDLLAYIGSKCAALRMLLVLTYRPTDLLLSKHPFVPVKRDLQARGVCREVALDLLSRQDMERYLALEFPEHRFPEELASLIHTKTEGNPLFMADLLRHLRDRQVLAQEQGRWVLAQSLPDLERELPESVRSMIERKIDQLGEEDRRLLVAASVQGYEFDSAVVAKALALDAAEVEEQLEALERVHAFVRFLREQEFPDGTPTVRYRFVHVLYQNALYATLRPTRKASLSATVAQALLGYYGKQSTAVASELALLLEAARDWTGAADHFLVASQNAARVYANQEAVTLARRALANAEKLQGEACHARILAAALHLAQVHLALSRFEDVLTDYGLAERTAREAGQAEAQISAICGTAMALFYLRRLPEVQQQGQRALQLARGVSSSVGVASAELALATERLCTGDLEAAEHYFDQAIPVLKEKGPPLHAMEAIGFRAILHTWRLEYADAERAWGWALPKAQELGHCFHILFSLFHRGTSLGNQGQLSAAMGTVEEAIRLAELNGDRYWLPRLPNTLGWLRRELLDMEAALRLDREGAQLAQEMGVPEGEANSHINLGHDYLVLGEAGRALEHLQAAERLFDQDVWFRWRYKIRLQAELASYWIVRGDLKAATAFATASLQLAANTLSRKHMAWAHKLLGDIAVLEDRVEDSQREFTAALHILDGHPCPVIAWRILKAWADVAKRLKDDSASADLLGRARAVVQSLASSIHDDKLRQRFLAAKPVRDLNA